MVFNVEESIGYEGGSYLYKCPKCTKTLRYTPSVGLYNCFSCGFSGKAGVNSDFEVQDQFELPKEVLQKVIDIIVDNFGLNQQCETYFIQRGMLGSFDWKLRTIGFDMHEHLFKAFSLEQLEKNYLAYKVTKNSYIKPSLALDFGRLFVPIWEKDRIVNFKTRQPILDFSNTEIKYVSLKGSKIGSNCFYLSDLSKRDLIVTEGELKTISLYNNGYFGFGFSGMSYSKTAFNKLLALIKSAKVDRVFVAFDNDKDLMVNPAKLLLHYRLLKSLRAVVDTSWIVLSKPNNGKMDIDTYFMEYGNDHFDWEMEKAWVNRDAVYKWLENKVRKCQ